MLLPPKCRPAPRSYPSPPSPPSHPARRRLVLAAAAASLGLPAFAQSGWPARPLRIVVPYPPGGFTDQMARLVQPGLQQRLGQTLVIENKPGANSLIGVDAVAKAAPDGHTLAVVIAAYAANTSLYPKLPYDPHRDLVGVSLLGVSPMLAATHLQAPFKTPGELVAYARAHPGRVSFGSSGRGSAVHLTTELWKAQTQTYMVHIPYRGTAPALMDLMGGQIQLLFDTPSSLMAPGRAGKIRLIGLAGEQRLPVLPELPTFIEQGFAGFSGSTWAGVLAPAGTARAIVERLAQELAQIIHGDAVRARLDAMGVLAAAGTPQQFDSFIAAESAKWGAVIRSAGVTPQD